MQAISQGLLNPRYVRLACDESLIKTAVLYCSLMHKDPHNAVIVWGILLDITNESAAFFSAREGVHRHKSKGIAHVPFTREGFMQEHCGTYFYSLWPSPQLPLTFRPL